MKKLIHKHVLKNAYEHKGTASAGAVINRVLGEKPELKKNMKELGQKIKKEIQEVNKLKIEDITKELKEKHPELLEKKDEERHDLPELPGDTSKVVMRMAPNPNGPLHLGHARQALLNWFYVKKYNGKYILRFDDTDPKNKIPMKEAYEWIIEDLKWLGITPDEVLYASNRLNIYYDYAEQLIKMGKAYICTCKPEEFRELKNKGQACPCRELPEKEQLKRWKKMFTEYKEGEAVYRVKTDLKAPNPALRDWPGFRIIENNNHPRNKKTRVWPLLNFNSSIDDHLTGITHIIRGRDLDFTEHQQKYLYKHFKWKYPKTITTGKLNLEGAILSSSEIKKGIKEGKYKGWNDEKLGTLKALKKKGIKPETIKQLIWDLGVRKNNATITWANIKAAQKKAEKNKTYKE